MLQNVNLKCNSIANGIMLARVGDTFHIADRVVTKPRHRGLTSTGRGCQGMLIDRSHFITAEPLLAAQDRVIIALNANANDIKLRDNRASRFRYFAISLFKGVQIISSASIIFIRAMKYQTAFGWLELP